MSQTIITNYKEEFSNLALTERSRKTDYSTSFFNHLDDLKQFEFLSSNSITGIMDESKFDMTDYLGLEQFIFDNTKIIETNEPKEIDWDKIDNFKDVLEDTIKKLLGKEKTSEQLKPIVNFTLDSFENHAVYNFMHPNSLHNPWFSTHNMLLNGYIYLISNEKDLVREYKPKLYKKKEKESKNIGIITKAKNEKEFKGVVLDDRFIEQNFVLDYLKDHANGFSVAKSKTKILKYLKDHNINISEGFLSTSVLLPLKRVGLIGSSNTGFYFINSEFDLKQSYEFHRSKAQAIQRTMDIYVNRANKMGINLI